jgi:uncharacterized protein
VRIKSQVKCDSYTNVNHVPRREDPARRWLLSSALTVAALSGTCSCIGCGPLGQRSWHSKFDWVAEEYFDDALTVSLCHAIEANDIAEIERLEAAGADVNAQGKGRMTPLLWSFPDNKLERFKKLLELGANPNVAFESDFNTRGGLSPGDSVTHMACRTAFPGYFEAVFEHTGDANLKSAAKVAMGDSPLIEVISGRARDKKQKVKLLIEKHADLNQADNAGTTAAMHAAGRGMFDIALVLIEAGADPSVYQSNQMLKLTHVLVRQERLLEHSTATSKADYDRLVEWLEKHGESLQEAKTDEERWASWGAYGLERKGELMDQEVKARLARKQRSGVTP